MTKFRTLVRVVRVGAFYIDVVVPAWNPKRIVTIERTSVLNNVNVAQRIYARVDLNASTDGDLDFSDWEI